MPRGKEPIDVFGYIVMRGPDECWAWTNGWGGRARDRRPYFQAGGRRTMAYRWVYELTTGQEIPDGMFVLHSCDQGGWPIGCCNPRHMRLGNVLDNAKDMTDRQRHGLPTNVIKAIRRLIKSGKTQHEIAATFGISRESVSAIATQRSYKHVPLTEEANDVDNV